MATRSSESSTDVERWFRERVARLWPAADEGRTHVSWFQTHLGLRGLALSVDVAERTGRLLLAFCLAYVLAIALGSDPQAAPARRDLEIPRRRPRHGTRRTLSVLSLAMQMLAHPRWCRRALADLRRLIRRLARGLPALRHPPPDLYDRLVLA